MMNRCLGYASGICVVTVLAIGCLAQTALAALPILPGGQGFGIETVAGSGRHLSPPRTTIIKVTNLDDSGPGSLRAGIEASGPRVCVFETSGVIHLAKNLVIRDPYITIAGQTAPSPGITLRGAGIVVASHDVLLQHLRIRVGDDPAGPEPNNRDGLIIGPVQIYRNGHVVPDLDIHHVVADHLSVSWAVDENISIWGIYGSKVRDISILDCVTSSGLHRSLHTNDGGKVTLPDGTVPHSKGMIIGNRRQMGEANPVERIALIRNLFAHNHGRNPLIKDSASDIYIANQLNYNTGPGMGGKVDIDGVDAESGIDRRNVSLVGCALIPGPDSPRDLREVRAGVGVNLFVEDNLGPRSDPHNPWSVVEGPASARALQPPVVMPGFVPLKSDAVEEYVLQHAGARPADRDRVDQRLMTEVRTRTGQIIDRVLPSGGSAYSQRDAGGWDNLAGDQNRRTLDVPAEPSGDDNGDGYTNLEEWLHGFSSEVEGG